MQRNGFEHMECPIARALDQIGDAWGLLILRTAMMGARQFGEFEQRCEIPASTLTRKLGELCERELLERRRYQAHPPRDEYVLTDKGRDLLPVFLAIAAWGNRWLAPEGVHIQAVDAKGGERVEPTVVDRRTGRALEAGTVALAAGPAASTRLRKALTPPIAFGAANERSTK